MEEVLVQEAFNVQFSRGYLIVSVNFELYDELLPQFQMMVLDDVARHNAKGVILNVSSVPIMDDLTARCLGEIERMTALLGAPAVVVGMRPEVAATLVHLGVSPGAHMSAINLDEAFRLLDQATSRGRKEPTGV